MIDLNFSNNRVVLDSLAGVFKRVENSPSSEIELIEISGDASPDGDYEKNLKLAKRRMYSLHNYLTKNLNVSDTIFKAGVCDVPWQEFREMIADSHYEWKGKVLEICSQGTDNSSSTSRRRMSRLKSLDGGTVWRVLKRDFLPHLRRSSMLQVVVSYVKVDKSVSDVRSYSEEEPAHQPETAYTEVEEFIESELITEPECSRTFHLSTNIVEWAMLIANINGEYDIANRWSAALSLHYSGVNYGSRVCKFRTFIVRPELRFWTMHCHKGLFIDAHLQMAYFNFALLSWKYRIQDRNGNHPALGGGLGIGYRLALGKSRWSLEAQVDAGIYHLNYDRFLNKPSGLLVDSRKRVWAGIDNVAISVVYNFKSKKR